MSRIRIFLVALALSGMAIGAAVARIPPVGSGWYEYTYYDSNNAAVGGRYTDCTGHTAYWGASSGARMKLTTGPC